MLPTFIIQQGIIQINSITVLRYSRTALLFHIDFKQKYAEYTGHSEFIGENHELSFFFGANKTTIGITDRKAKNAEIRVVGLPASWSNQNKRQSHFSVNMGRYSAQVFLIRNSSRHHMFYPG